MALLEAILAPVAEFALATIEALGYGGVFFLMVLESMIFPVPSEAVLPFAGFLAAQGKMDFTLALLAGTAGTLVGSLLSYGMGAYGLKPLLERYGKYVLVTPHHLEQAHRLFERRSAGVAIFVSRFIPAVRHIVSIPAGSARMPLGMFCLATVAGGAAWNFILLYAGFVLGENWHLVEEQLAGWKLVALVLVAAAVLAAAVWWVYVRKPRGEAS